MFYFDRIIDRKTGNDMSRVDSKPGSCNRLANGSPALN